jgi:hypothetical protein
MEPTTNAPQDRKQPIRSNAQGKPKRSFSGNRRPHDRQRRPAWPSANADGSAITESIDRKTAHIPDPEPGTIRIIPLGGVEEIGKNMTAIEIGNDIIVIDAGMYFSNENTPGIDYVIPNTRYLEERKDRIRGLILTHGHLDHIGGVPIVLSRIGNPPVYSRNLSLLLTVRVPSLAKDEWHCRRKRRHYHAWQHQGAILGRHPHHSRLNGHHH